MAKAPQYKTPPRPVIPVTPDEGEERVRRDTRNAVTMDGKAVAAQPHAMFSVGLGQWALGTRAPGRQERRHAIRVLPGVRVVVESSHTT